MEQQADKLNDFDQLKAYLDKNLPAFIGKCQADPQFAKHKQCTRLVSLLGFSPATTVLATAALRPKELVVITSKEALAKGDYALVERLIKELKLLGDSQPNYEVVDIVDPTKIYAEVIRYANEITVFVDVTGGTKIMTAAAAQAAWENNAQSCYINSKFGHDKKIPEPGTEQLLLLENPSEAKGKKCREKGLDSWENRLFSQARDAFKDSYRLNNVRDFEEIAIPLCEFYESLFNFNDKKLKESRQEVINMLNTKALQKLLNKINLQDHFDLFNAEESLKDPTTKIAVFLFLSREYSQLGRYDFAGLLSYRAIEELVGEGLRRLSTDGNFNRDMPKYETLKYDGSDLEHEFVELCRKVDKGKKAICSLPEKIGLGHGYALLLVLAPGKYGKFNGKLYKEKDKALQMINGICRCRNKSILAHGDSPLGEQDYGKIYDLAKSISEMVFEGDTIIRLIKQIELPDLKALLQ